MKLDGYLKARNLTLQAFGAKVGVSHVTVMRWAKGESSPRDQETLRRIAEATEGAVTAADFFGGTAMPSVAAVGFAEAQSPYNAQARALGLDPEAIAAAALKQAIGEEKARRWAEENREAIAAHNRWVDQHGTLLAKYRHF